MAQAHIDGARKRKEAALAVKASVDSFFEERQVKLEQYVPKPLKYRQLGIGLYKLYFEDGGIVPRDFAGMYTSLREVDKAIIRYAQKCLDKQ